jgi:hypothetical protein
LQAAVCIQGLLMVAPNRWDPATRATLRPLRRGFPRRRHLETKRGAVREEEALSAGGGIAPAGRRPTLEIGGKQRRERVKERMGGLRPAGLGLGL